jgi:hypothetical protein
VGKKKMENCSFNTEVAAKYGIGEAILIRNFQLFIGMNASNGRNIYDDRIWSYDSVAALRVRFPFWTTRQINRILKNLIDQKILVTGNYNQHKYDRTTWYAFYDHEEWLQPSVLVICPKRQITESAISPNGQMDSTKTSNGVDQNVKPIPVVIPVVIPVTIFFEEFWSVYPRKADKKRCLKIWEKNDLESLGEIIVNDVKEKVQRQFPIEKSQKSFIPLPTTYLNGERWNDEVIDRIQPNDSSESKYNSKGYVKSDNTPIHASQKLWKGHPVAKKSDKPRHIKEMLNGS